MLCRSTMVCLALLGAAAPASAQMALELTFDDATGAPELSNLETDSGVQARLVGDARRSSIGEGRYGRAADLPGGSSGIVVAGWTPRDAMATYMWLRARDVSTGMLVGEMGAWAARLAAGEIVIAVVRDRAPEILRTGVRWPTDGAHHHVAVRIDGGAFFVSIDFAPEVSVAPATPATRSAQLGVGLGLDGLIDELVIAARPFATRSHEMDRFNRWPEECPEGTACAEEVITMTPGDLGYEVPVRLKTIWVDEVCHAGARCPLVVAVSGGGACANDYETPDVLADLAARGHVVVTVDPYCEGTGGATDVILTEIPQLVAAKDHALDHGVAADRIEGRDYHATGCSHGAEAVMVWALMDGDHPARSLVRSAGGSGVCARLAGAVCGAEVPETIDFEDPRIRALHERADLVAKITAEVAATREVARTWGRNLEGPVCNGDGSFACSEEGRWGMTYASRRFRDVWERLQPEGAPTGYFVEDEGADCRHCAPVGSAAYECGACMLRHGRAGMELACPSCLDYADETIAHGEPAELCPLPATWYVDPVAQPSGEGADAGPPGRDAGAPPADDAGAPSMDALPSGGSGCAAVGHGGIDGLGLALAALVLVRRRQRQSARA